MFCMLYLIVLDMICQFSSCLFLIFHFVIRYISTSYATDKDTLDPNAMKKSIKQSLPNAWLDLYAYIYSFPLALLKDIVCKQGKYSTLTDLYGYLVGDMLLGKVSLYKT